MAAFSDVGLIDGQHVYPETFQNVITDGPCMAQETPQVLRDEKRMAVDEDLVYPLLRAPGVRQSGISWLFAE